MFCVLNTQKPSVSENPSEVYENDTDVVEVAPQRWREGSVNPRTVHIRGKRRCLPSTIVGHLLTADAAAAATSMVWRRLAASSWP